MVYGEYRKVSKPYTVHDYIYEGRRREYARDLARQFALRRVMDRVQKRAKPAMRTNLRRWKDKAYLVKRVAENRNRALKLRARANWRKIKNSFMK